MRLFFSFLLLCVTLFSSEIILSPKQANYIAKKYGKMKVRVKTSTLSGGTKERTL